MVLNYTYERKPWPAQLVDMYQFDNSWTRLRLIGGTSTYYQFWLQLNRGGRIVSVEKICACRDSEVVMRACPYCKARLKGKRMVLANAIIRKLQRTPPTTIGGLTEYERTVREINGESVRWKENGSGSWTPIRVIRLPPTLATQITNFSHFNSVHEPKTSEFRRYNVAHPRYGRDIRVRYDGEYTYEARVDLPTSLTKEELHHLRYPLDLPKPETLREAKREWKRLKPILLTE
jgi:hypothetical protein